MKTLNHVFAKIKHRVDQACLDSCNEIANGIKDEAYKRANLDPNEVAYSIYQGHDNIGNFSTYMSNFKVKDANQVANTISGRAYNDFRVSCKYGIVPFGHFIEWGTGLTGLNTEDGTWSSSDYTLEPWDQRTAQQSIDTNTHGMVACPHWTPSYYLYDAKKKEIFSNNLRKLL